MDQQSAKWFRIYAFLTISAFAFLIGSPFSAGPDEPEHQATAWYDTHHFTTVPVYHQVIGGLPPKLITPPCYATKPSQNASCLDHVKTSESVLREYKINNYPQLPYLIIGSGQILFNLINPNLSPFGGRLFLFLSCILLLTVASKLLCKSGKGNLNAIVILFSSPMMLFLIATANPSGFEFAAAITFTSALFFSESRQDFKSWGVLTFCGVIFSMSRPISFVWLTLIASAFIILKSSKKQLQNFKPLLASILPGVAFGVYWKFTHPTYLDYPGYIPENVTNHFTYFIKEFFKSINLIPLHLEQSWGILGWLDTRPLAVVWLFIIALWSWFILGYFSSSFRTMKLSLIVILSIILGISALEASASQYWPGWWQGRYQVPVLVGIFLVIIDSSTSNFEKYFRAMLAPSLIFLLYMVVLNFARYNWGVVDGLPFNIHGNAYSAPRILFFAVLIIILVLQFFRILRIEFKSAPIRN